MYSLTSQAHTDDRVMTKVVASPMPKAVSSFLETPMKGQIPRNFTSTKLLTSTVPTRMRAYSVMGAGVRG
jgi:hypothetical protein